MPTNSWHAICHRRCLAVNKGGVESLMNVLNVNIVAQACKGTQALAETSTLNQYEKQMNGAETTIVPDAGVSGVDATPTIAMNSGINGNRGSEGPGDDETDRLMRENSKDGASRLNSSHTHN